jgi:hypothetical protein
VTPHLTDANLSAILESNDSVDESVRLHIVKCGVCRAALATAKAQEFEVSQLLELLTVTQPDMDAVKFVRGVVSSRSLARAQLRRTRFRHIVRGAVAASILTASVAAAALTPSSVLRRWVHVAAVASGLSSDQPSAQAESPEQSPASQRGVEIFPHGRVDVVFRSNQSSGVVRIVSASNAEISVSGTGDGPNYTVGYNTIIVSNQPGDSLNFVVGIPQLSGSDTVYVRIAGKTVYSNLGNHVTARTPADHNGQIILPFQNLRR